MNQERHGNCWVMRGTIFAFFTLCFLLFLTLLAGRHSDSTPGNYYCCLFPLFPLNVPTDFSGYFSWTGNGQEWTWCCSRMDIRVCVFSLSVFFVVVCTIFICCAVFLWAPEHLCDHGLDLWDHLIMWEFIQSINQAHIFIRSGTILNPIRYGLRPLITVARFIMPLQ